MKVEVLGSGTSQGIPVIGCGCKVCQSDDEHDDRLRCSILIEIDSYVYVIDTGPDFRQQMLRANVKRLDGIFYTHEHKDHIAGMDDVRAFNFLQKKPMSIYCNSSVEEALKREFYYVFNNDDYPGIPKVNIHKIDSSPFRTKEGLEVIPIEVLHYKLPVLGFRINDFAYITDAKTVAEEEIEKLKGIKVLIVNALRRQEHISHFNLDQALAFIKRVNPEKAYLTHISHLFDTHVDIEKELPENVRVAYDGLILEFENT